MPRFRRGTNGREKTTPGDRVAVRPTVLSNAAAYPRGTMESFERVTFDSDDSKRIYRYVDRHGTVARDRVREALDMQPDRFQRALTRLEDEAYLEETGDGLQLSVDFGETEEYETEEFTYAVEPARDEHRDELVGTILRDVTATETYVVAERVGERLLYDETVIRHNPVESNAVFVATVDGAVVGWVHLELPQAERLRETGTMTVGVREEYRGNGIGSTLLRKGIDWAETNGYRKLYISVPAINENAVEFLDAHGWEMDAVREEYYTIDGEPVDEVMMAYEI